MAQKKKKGPAPRVKDAGPKKMSVRQIAFVIFAILAIAAMILPMLITT